MVLIKHITFFLLLAGVFFVMPIQLFAQPVDPCTDPTDPCPIDSNLIVLVTAALAIAAKKAYDYKKAPQNIQF